MSQGLALELEDLEQTGQQPLAKPVQIWWGSHQERFKTSLGTSMELQQEDKTTHGTA